MSNEDPYRQDPYRGGHDPQRGGGDYGRDRGAYTPPTDDDLPFTRGGYDSRYDAPRRPTEGPRRPPVTLIISILVLLALAAAVFFLYFRPGLGASQDAPPAIGQPVESFKAEAPLDAQPIDPEAGIDVYADSAAPTETPTYAPEPEAVLPRPAPSITPSTGVSRPPSNSSSSNRTPAARPELSRPDALVVPSTASFPPPNGGQPSVQIGAFSTPTIADNEYALVVSRFPQLTRGASKRVQEVTASNGSILYRTTVHGLSPESATRLCDAIRAAGDDCFVR